MNEPISFLGECGLDEGAGKQAVAYLAAGVGSLGAMPSTSCVVAERFFDESGGQQLVLHAPFGSRINRAWGLALRKRFCRTFNFELQAAATDNGIVISLSEQHAFPLETVFEFVRSDQAEDVLRQALLASPMFTARWRWNASRALAVPRFSGGKKTPAPIQRMRAEDLLAAVFPDQVACAENLTGPICIPDHPLVNETISNCLHEAMDIDGLRRVLEGIEDGSIRAVSIESAAPSVFSHEILNANPYAFLDDAPLEERRTRAVQMRSTMRADFANGAGVLDPAAIEEIAAEVWPEPRDPDELHDALLTLITAPPLPEWEAYFESLRATGRVFEMERGGKPFWAATERRDAVADVLTTIRGWMEHLGPVTASELAGRLALPVADVHIALAAAGSRRAGFRRPLPGTSRRRTRVVQPAHSGAHPPADAGAAAARNRAGDGGAGSTSFWCDGSTLRPARSCTEPTACCRLFASCRVSRFLRRHGNHRSSRAGSPNTAPKIWTSCVYPGSGVGAPFAAPGADRCGPARVRPTRIAPVSFFLREDADWLLDPGFAVSGDRRLLPCRAGSAGGADGAGSVVLRRSGARHQTAAE